MIGKHSRTHNRHTAESPGGVAGALGIHAARLQVRGQAWHVGEVADTHDHVGLLLSDVLAVGGQMVNRCTFAHLGVREYRDTQPMLRAVDLEFLRRRLQRGPKGGRLDQLVLALLTGAT